MKAITISRQLGSLGSQTAEAVAEMLGYKVYCREVINQAALRSRSPEAALATIDELGLLSMKPTAKEARAYQEAVRELLHELYEEGQVVLVGRAGQAILHDLPGVLHVRIYAPMPVRVARVAERHSVSPAMAEQQVTTSDQSRNRYVRRYYGVRWDDPELYDLMINTAHLSAQDAAAIIFRAVEQCGAG